MLFGSVLSRFVVLAFLLSVLARAQAARRDPILSVRASKSDLLPEDIVVGSAVQVRPGVYEFTTGETEEAVAWGVYLDSSLTVSNFGQLRVVTNERYPDNEQMTAAGFVEGYLTAERIMDHYTNLKSYFSNQLNATIDNALTWFKHQDAWLRKQVAANAALGNKEQSQGHGRASKEGNPGPESSTCQPLAFSPGTTNPGSSFWRLAGLMVNQFDGMVAGYGEASKAAAAAGRSDAAAPLGFDDLLFLNSNGDMYDVLDFLDAGYRPKYDNMTANQLLHSIALAGKCSALIKVVGDLSDLLLGHSTWDSFTAMTHIFKHYEFRLSDPSVVSHQLSFSSYPGELFSDDDFYITDAGLAVMETTNHVFNHSLLQNLTHESVLSWQRMRIALLSSDDGEGWIRAFSTHNSGTYNNQYMVLDFDKFVKGLRLDPGLLWVVEQVPGLVLAADMTGTLERGYWPSYNVPYFPTIYNLTGYPDFVQQHGGRGPSYEQPTRWLMYQASPRANIMRRDQGGVADLEALKALMRYNGWQEDSYSGGHPVAAVCGRGDLAQEDAVPKGCYDSKVTSYKLAMHMEAEVVNGPTTQGQEPFEWSEKWSEYLHRGMPKKFDFKFERMSAKKLPLPSERLYPAEL